MTLFLNFIGYLLFLKIDQLLKLYIIYFLIKKLNLDKRILCVWMSLLKYLELVKLFLKEV